MDLEENEKALVQSKHNLNAHDEVIKKYDKIIAESTDPDEISDAKERRDAAQAKRDAEQLVYDFLKESMDSARKHL